MGFALPKQWIGQDSRDKLLPIFFSKWDELPQEQSVIERFLLKRFRSLRWQGIRAISPEEADDR